MRPEDVARTRDRRERRAIARTPPRRDALASGAPESDFVACERRRDGEHGCVAINSAPVRDAAGRPEGVVKTLSDITRAPRGRGAPGRQRAGDAACWPTSRRRCGGSPRSWPPSARPSALFEQRDRRGRAPARRAEPRASCATSDGREGDGRGRRWAEPRRSTGSPVGATRAARQRHGDRARAGAPASRSASRATRASRASWPSACARWAYGPRSPRPVSVGGRAVGRAGRLGPRPDDLPEGTEEQAARLRRARRAGAGQRRCLRAARRLARADRRGRRRRAPAPGAQPARRRPAAARRARPPPAAGRGAARRRTRTPRARELAEGRTSSSARRCRAARARARHPPRRAHRSRAEAGAWTRWPIARAGPDGDHGLALRIGSRPRSRPPRTTSIAEAVTNVAKYAGATYVAVSVRPRGRPDGRGACADDGVGGADPAAGTGLRGIADRVEALHGRLRINSPAGSGTRITAEIPIG